MTTTITYPAHTYAAEVLVAAGASEVLEMPGCCEASIAAHPGAGGTAGVEYSLSSLEKVKGGTARWLPWASGAVSVATGDAIPSPITALRFTATTAAAVFEVLQRED